MGAWRITVPPAKDELLSGWLCRVAFAQGCTPYGLCVNYLNDQSLWARDVDRGPVSPHLESLAALSQLDVTDLRSMTLMPWIERLSKRYRKPSSTTVTPWINAAGVFHRKRRRHALSYCPECLAATGVVRKQWRLAFMVTCEIHKRMLRDGCPRCDAPFVPHRSLRDLRSCDSCGYGNLTREATKTANDEASLSAGVADLQRRLLASVENGLPTIENGPCMLEDLRAVVSVLLARPNVAVTMDCLSCLPVGVAQLTGRLEFSRVSERIGAMRACHALIANWPASIRTVAAKLALTQRPFVRLAFGRWLGEEVDRLPPGTTHSRRALAPSLGSRVARIHALRPKNWRAERARLILRGSRLL